MKAPDCSQTEGMLACTEIWISDGQNDMSKKLRDAERFANVGGDCGSAMSAKQSAFIYIIIITPNDIRQEQNYGFDQVYF